MAMTKATTTETEARIEQLLAQREDAAAQERMREETRRSVQQFEAKYGISSEQIHQAIDDGSLIETFEVCRWIIEYNLLARAEPR